MENLRNWITKYQDEDGYGKQFSCLPSQVSTEEVEGNNGGGKSEIDILDNQYFSKETIEQSDENCSTSKEVSTIRLHRQAFRRKQLGAWIIGSYKECRSIIANNISHQIRKS